MHARYVCSACMHGMYARYACAATLCMHHRIRSRKTWIRSGKNRVENPRPLLARALTPAVTGMHARYMCAACMHGIRARVRVRMRVRVRVRVCMRANSAITAGRRWRCDQPNSGDCGQERGSSGTPRGGSQCGRGVGRMCPRWTGGPPAGWVCVSSECQPWKSVWYCSCGGIATSASASASFKAAG
jgi:hypothetical protein